MVFGASEYVSRIRPRLFHTGGRRFSGVAYRVAPDPDGSTTWMPDAYREANLRGAAEHIPSICVASAGHPTILVVGTTTPRC